MALPSLERDAPPSGQEGLVRAPEACVCFPALGCLVLVLRPLWAQLPLRSMEIGSATLPG